VAAEHIIGRLLLRLDSCAHQPRPAPHPATRASISCKKTADLPRRSSVRRRSPSTSPLPDLRVSKPISVSDRALSLYTAITSSATALRRRQRRRRCCFFLVPPALLLSLSLSIRCCQICRPCLCSFSTKDPLQQILEIEVQIAALVLPTCLRVVKN
ncbi:hypothetical protein U9M48_015309, partial [Paspalum notatum var. saurae]